MHLRALFASAALAVTSLTSLFGCNFILNPEGDGVIRCDNADECDVPLASALADNRGQSRCAAAGGGGGGFTQGQDNKVCSVVDNEDVSCDPNVLVMSKGDIGERLTEVADDVGVYRSCASRPGTLGCPPDGGACTEGKVRNYKDIGDSKDQPVYAGVDRQVCASDNPLTVAPTAALEKFDILDQHCRSYFCDESFVCARGKGSSDFRCRRCDPELPYGAGGCGEMYIYGKTSTTYVDPGAMCEAEANAELTHIGPVVEVIPTCDDGEMNGDETDIDCGGATCDPCA